MEYINTIGRRKEAVARVYLSQGKGEITVNKMKFEEYFPIVVYQHAVTKPLKITNSEGKYDIRVVLNGGGAKGQSEALSLAISRALVQADAEVKPVLKENGMFTRDPREVERKKPGQPKARKKFQFSKR